MYIRHIDHRSGTPWGPHGREGAKFFSGKRGPMGGPRGMHISYIVSIELSLKPSIWAVWDRFVSTDSRVPWGPLLYPEGAHGPHPMGPPHGLPHGALFLEKKFSRLCRENFFPPSRPWGPHGAPDLWSICLIYIEICSCSWKVRFRHRFKQVLWLKYRLYKILRFFFHF